MSQARGTWHFARSARRGEEKKNIKSFIFFSSFCIPLHARLKMPRSPRLAHEAPVMQVRKETRLAAVIRCRKIDTASL